jgi:2-phospho-L-lactate/phosphoenolpyruvate guanylyltransferase
MPSIRVLAVPVKPLARSKTRLAPALSPAERAELTLAMLEDVLDACTAQPVWETWVISGAPEALEVARRHGARGVPENGSTLLEAVRQAETELAAIARGAEGVEAEQLAVVLADLPLLTADALSRALALSGAVVAAPATSDGGTNLLLRRPPTAIPARFGRSSYRRHRAGAYRRGLTFNEARAIELGFDLDRPTDLLSLLASDADTRARSACQRMGLAARLRVGA